MGLLKFPPIILHMISNKKNSNINKQYTNQNDIIFEIH
jgi:hypothetical protein